MLNNVCIQFTGFILWYYLIKLSIFLPKITLLKKKIHAFFILVCANLWCCFNPLCWITFEHLKSNPSLWLGWAEDTVPCLTLDVYLVDWKKDPDFTVPPWRKEMMVKCRPWQSIPWEVMVFFDSRLWQLQPKRIIFPRGRDQIFTNP